MKTCGKPNCDRLNKLYPADFPHDGVCPVCGATVKEGK